MSAHDPMEAIVAAALDEASMAYKTGEGGHNPTGLDFLLTDSGVEIEVKRFHTPRVSEQMQRSDNVIVAQGEVAVRLLADWIRAAGNG